jgi:hypothetical protein
LLVRRMLAKELENEKLDKDPVIQSGIKIARDRILSDIKLQRIDNWTNNFFKVMYATILKFSI